MASTVTLEIPVTQRHIDKGLPRNPFCCPVALAIQDRTNLRCHVSDSVQLSYELDDIGIETEMPEEADEFIVRFDYGDSVEPFSFPLERLSRRTRYD